MEELFMNSTENTAIIQNEQTAVTVVGGVNIAPIKRSDGTEYIKVGYHEGLVDSETWLAVQDKKSSNKRIPNNGTAKHSWLVGLLKCAHCNYAFVLQYNTSTSNKKHRYLQDSGMYKADGCVKKRIKLKPDEIEEIVYDAMKKRLEALEIAKQENKKPDAETETLKTEVIRFDDEIRKLLDKLADADEVLFGYIQDKVKILHEKKSELEEKLRTKTRKHKAIDTAPLSDPMSRWDSLTMNEKNALAKTMIDVIYISDETGVDIKFSI